MNTLAATEIKRRGMGIADPLLAKGPVYIIKNNRPQYVLLREADFASLMKRNASATAPKEASAAADFKAQRDAIWGRRVFSKDETERMTQWEAEREGV